MRITKIGHALFAIAMIGTGTIGLFSPDLMPVWNPAPGAGELHALLMYLAVAISLATGVGLLIHRTAAIAARILVAALSLWMLLFRLPNYFSTPLFAACWSVFPLLVMLSAAIVLCVGPGSDRDRKYLRIIGSKNGLHLARVFYGLSLVFFGLAHFIDMKDTLSLIPGWLPGHLFWAYFTGCAFIAAGLAVVLGLWARLAAILATWQIGSFLLLVWIPIVTAGSKVAFQWSETFLNAALLAAAWTIADSYEGAPLVPRSRP